MEKISDENSKDKKETHGVCNNRFNSCGCYTHIKWLGNYYSNRLSPSFNICCFWHDWWSCVDLRLTMFHFGVTHWYPLWCRMWMRILLWFSILGLNIWMNLLTLWSQLAAQLHAFQFVLNYKISWYLPNHVVDPLTFLPHFITPHV